jgi:hypothetical protein
MINEAYERLNTGLKYLLDDEQNKWLESALDQITNSDDLINDLLNLSAATRRKLGADLLGSDVNPLQLTSGLFARHWTVADAGRVLLVLRSVLTVASQAQTLIQTYFQQGDETEVAAITRMLILFENGETLKPFALEVGRTNSKPLFAALAQYNPYPAKYYSDHEFNQLVLKALFLGIGIDPVIGLLKRANPELSQMCEDYIKERVAANRSIPSDIWLALEPCASAEGETLMVSHLVNDSPRDRYYIVKALLQQNPLSPKRQQLLNEHQQVEKDPIVLALFAKTTKS